MSQLLIRRGFKTELRPTPSQVLQLTRYAGTARWAYNWGLQRRNEALAAGLTAPNAIELHRELTALKGQRWRWLYEVAASVPKEALRNLDDAHRRFVAALRRGDKDRAHPPRFKARHRGIGSFRMPPVRIGCDYIRLTRIGSVRLKEKGYLPTRGARILSITVSERCGRWFVSAQAEMTIEVPPQVGPACGLDLGLTRLGACSDGTLFLNPKAGRRVAKALRRARRIARRRRSNTANRRRIVHHINKLELRAANIRMDAIHKMTTALTRNKSTIVIEDLRPNQMLRHPTLGIALRDASFGEIRRQLGYKAVWRGSTVIVAPRWYASSQTCSVCGALRPTRLSLAQRRFECPSCGAELDRDVNAARNLLSVAASSADTQNACGEGVSTLNERLSSLNQESAIRRSDGETENGGNTAVVVDLVDFVLISDDREE